MHIVVCVPDHDGVTRALFGQIQLDDLLHVFVSEHLGGVHKDELGGDGLLASHALLLRALHDQEAPEALKTYGRLAIIVIASYGVTHFGGKLVTANVTL